MFHIVEKLYQTNVFDYIWVEYDGFLFCLLTNNRTKKLHAKNLCKKVGVELITACFIDLFCV